MFIEGNSFIYTDWTWTLRLSSRWSTRLRVIDAIFLGFKNNSTPSLLSTPTLTASRLTTIPRTPTSALILIFLLSPLTRSSTPVCEFFFYQFLFWLLHFSATQRRALPCCHLPPQLRFNHISPYNYLKNFYICVYLLYPLQSSSFLPSPTPATFDHISPYHYLNV